MFGTPRRLFTLAGFPIKLDPGWAILALLVTGSLATGLFPTLFPDWSARDHWLMGLAGMLGLMASVVLHELAHALVARRQGLPVEGITLFLLGGMAELREEPRTARGELLMAGAGPLMSLLLAGLCGLALWTVGRQLPIAVGGLLAYLLFVNGLLALFNLVPAFPLDGGRMLRALLWARSGDLLRATRNAARLGAGFGWLMVAAGLWSLLSGNLLGGLWWGILGLFLAAAARGSYRQLLLRESLRGEPVARFMLPPPAAVPAAASLREWFDRFVSGSRDTRFPVTLGERAVGVITTEALRRVPPAAWPERRVIDLAERLTDSHTVGPEADLFDALLRMHRRNAGWLLVVRDGEVVGLVLLPDLMRLARARGAEL